MLALAKQVRAVGKGLIELGLEPFHTVAILGHNDPAWHIRSELVPLKIFLVFSTASSISCISPATWLQFMRVVSQRGSTRQTQLQLASISQMTVGLLPKHRLHKLITYSLK